MIDHFFENGDWKYFRLISLINQKNGINFLKANTAFQIFNIEFLKSIRLSLAT